MNLNMARKREDIEEGIITLERRQIQKGFDKMRAGLILRLRERLAVISIREAHSGVNLNLVNKNNTEDAFAKLATSEGWSVVKRGWPDYLCWKDDEVIFVEVKPERDDLSIYQKVVMKKLSSLGLKCFKWTPVKGYTPVSHL